MQLRACTTIAAAALLLLGAGACTDITTEPRSTVTGANIFNDNGSYRAFVAKLYAGLAVSGQQGAAGAGDIEGIDEGFSQYLRLIWQMQELPTDEAIIAWQDAGLPELNTQIWSSSNPFLGAMYYRIFFQVSLANEFLRETTDEKLQSRGVGTALRADIQQYRAEARFLRALSYWHGIDLFGSIPLVTEADAVGAAPPRQATRKELFDYVVAELNGIRDALPARPQYGRAGRAAADMLLAKLYLNAQVYAGENRYAEARTAAERVIAAGYALDDRHQDIFLADNHTSPEIIFPITQDGRNTRTFGGMTFIAHASVGGNVMNAADYGLNGGWWGLRTRPQLVALFPGAGPASPDRRSAFFFTQGQTLDITSVSDFTKGYAAPKNRNITSTGQPGSNSEFVDIDFPVFRLGDAYLMYAEAVLRGGGGTRAQALAYVNALRQRAYGNASGNVTDAQLTLDFILAERARELMWEGHRRTDLIRFDRFTDNGTWAWKGNVAAGRTTEAFRDLYPLPASELLANPNLTQNTGY
ncbi:MAG TPA: RagB/SusD family nutrient uptake outer membrane protein [Longimicrobiaceae bacterium]|nr:RagB/SusD family nutrient uptake outer membrane protein [Longimicrobiaceae bacterium]